MPFDPEHENRRVDRIAFNGYRFREGPRSVGVILHANNRTLARKQGFTITARHHTAAAALATRDHQGSVARVGVLEGAFTVRSVRDRSVVMEVCVKGDLRGVRCGWEYALCLSVREDTAG